MKETTSTSYPEWYRRNLPHWQPPNAVLFVTTCLDGALPRHRIAKIRAERASDVRRLEKEGWTSGQIKEWLNSRHDHYFGKYDTLLDEPEGGPHHLKMPEAAEIVKTSLLRFHE